MDLDYLKIIRDQVVFVAAFFSIFGLIMTDSYYTTFGIKYQFLALGPTHVLYRGFTLIYFDPAFTSIFLVVLIGILISRFKFQLRIGPRRLSGQVVIYIVLSIALIGGGYLAFVAGVDTAGRDMYAETTTLRQITYFSTASGEKSSFVQRMMAEGKPLLLLQSSGREIVVFNSPAIRASRPRIDVHHIGLSSDDFYTDRTPLFR